MKPVTSVVAEMAFTASCLLKVRKRFISTMTGKTRPSTREAPIITVPRSRRQVRLSLWVRWVVLWRWVVQVLLCRKFWTILNLFRSLPSRRAQFVTRREKVLWEVPSCLPTPWGRISGGMAISRTVVSTIGSTQRHTFSV